MDSASATVGGDIAAGGRGGKDGARRSRMLIRFTEENWEIMRLSAATEDVAGDDAMVMM